MYDGRYTFFEGVQAGRLDHGLRESIPLGECVREEGSFVGCSLAYRMVFLGVGTGGVI